MKPDYSYYLAKNFDLLKLPPQTIPVILVGERHYWLITPNTLAWFTKALENAVSSFQAANRDLTQFLAPCRLIVELSSWASLVYPQEELTKISDPTYIPRLPEPVLKGPEM